MKQKYIRTAWRIASARNRWRLYEIGFNLDPSGGRHAMTGNKLNFQLTALDGDLLTSD